MPDPTASGTAPSAETAREPEAPKPEPEAIKAKRGPKPQLERVEALEQSVTQIASTLDTVVALLTAQKADETPAPNDPVEVEVVEWGEDGNYIYSSISKNHTLIRVAGERVEINGQVVLRHQQSADFLEGQWTAPSKDWSDWIESTDEFKKGIVRRGITLRRKGPSIHTGPKTTTQPERTPKDVARPHGELSAAL